MRRQSLGKDTENRRPVTQQRANSLDRLRAAMAHDCDTLEYHGMRRAATRQGLPLPDLLQPLSKSLLALSTLGELSCTSAMRRNLVTGIHYSRRSRYYAVDKPPP